MRRLQGLQNERLPLRCLHGCTALHVAVQVAGVVAHQVEHPRDEGERLLLQRLLLFDERAAVTQAAELAFEQLAFAGVGRLQVGVGAVDSGYAVRLCIGSRLGRVFQRVDLQHQCGQGRVQLHQRVVLCLALAVQNGPVVALQGVEPVLQAATGCGNAGGVFQLVDLRDERSQGRVQLHDGVVLCLALPVQNGPVIALQGVEPVLQAAARGLDGVTHLGQLREDARHFQQHGDGLAALFGGFVLRLDQCAVLGAGILGGEVWQLHIHLAQVFLDLPLQVRALLFWRVEVAVVGGCVVAKRIQPTRQFHQRIAGLIAVG